MAAAISCSASHNESHISLKILCLLKYAVLKVILCATKVKQANGRSEIITPISEILVKLCGSWTTRSCYCIKINWFTLMERWYDKEKPHMEIRITSSFMLVLCCIRHHCREKQPPVFSCLLIPASKAFHSVEMGRACVTTATFILVRLSW